MQTNGAYAETTDDSSDDDANRIGDLQGEHQGGSPPTYDDDAGSQDMDEDDPLYDVFYRRPVVHCTNCTQTLYSNLCSACGHDYSTDDSLFALERDLQPEPSTSARTSLDALIVWDEQMLLHEEGESAPHPERCDA